MLDYGTSYIWLCMLASAFAFFILEVFHYAWQAPNKIFCGVVNADVVPWLWICSQIWVRYEIAALHIFVDAEPLSYF